MADYKYLYNHFWNIAGWVLFVIAFIYASPLAFDIIKTSINQIGKPNAKELLMEDLNKYNEVKVEIWDIDIMNDHMNYTNKYPRGLSSTIGKGEISTQMTKQYLLQLGELSTWGNFQRSDNNYKVFFEFENGDKFLFSFTVFGVIVFEGPGPIGTCYFYKKRNITYNKQFLEFLFRELHVNIKKHGKWK